MRSVERWAGRLGRWCCGVFVSGAAGTVCQLFVYSLAGHASFLLLGGLAILLGDGLLL